jgi:hypothetical protein
MKQTRTNQKSGIHDEKIIVINENKIKSVPLFCPRCSYPLENSDDATCFKQNGCCSKCQFKSSVDENYLETRLRLLQNKPLIFK